MIVETNNSAYIGVKTHSSGINFEAKAKELWKLLEGMSAGDIDYLFDIIRRDYIRWYCIATPESPEKSS